MFWIQSWKHRCRLCRHTSRRATARCTLSLAPSAIPSGACVWTSTSKCLRTTCSGPLKHQVLTALVLLCSLHLCYCVRCICATVLTAFGVVLLCSLHLLLCYYVHCVLCCATVLTAFGVATVSTLYATVTAKQFLLYRLLSASADSRYSLHLLTSHTISTDVSDSTPASLSVAPCALDFLCVSLRASICVFI